MMGTILVVDDEADIATLFRRRFRRELRDGIYGFCFAMSGEEALSALRGNPEPHVMLILSDINMPGMSGLELLARVKEVRPDLSVVMITAYGDADNRQRALERGAVDFLGKPIDFNELKQKLPSLINQSGDA